MIDTEAAERRRIDEVSPADPVEEQQGSQSLMVHTGSEPEHVFYYNRQ